MNRNDTKLGRFYDVEDGVTLPSVTTILSVIGKPALVNWAANEERTLVTDVAASLYEDLAGTPRMTRAAYLTTLAGRLGKEKQYRKTAAKAAEIGTQAHHLAEWNIRRRMGQVVAEEPRVSEKAMWAFMAFEDWMNRTAFEPITVEQTIWSRSHGYAGTLDILASVDGVLTVVDIKTSKAIYPEYGLQVAAYAEAVSEMGHGEPRRGVIVRLPKNEKDPEFEAVEVPPFTELMPVFLHTLELWKWQHENEVRRAAEWQAGKVAAEKAAGRAA